MKRKRVGIDLNMRFEKKNETNEFRRNSFCIQKIKYCFDRNYYRIFNLFIVCKDWFWKSNPLVAKFFASSPNLYIARYADNNLWKINLDDNQEDDLEDNYLTEIKTNIPKGHAHMFDNKLYIIDYMSNNDDQKNKFTNS